MPSELLTRDQFREAVFARDGHKCVICGYDPRGMGAAGRAGLDAHHIMERRLWPDGGYYLDNGATLCSRQDAYPSCHLHAEQTAISPYELCQRIGVTRLLLPPHLYTDAEYDKWGNVVLPNGQRLKGELFDDESVQKVLPLSVFTDRVKYPRTYHLPWSPGLTSDDRKMSDLSQLEGHEVVITLKMDGEQTTIYPDGYCHARSLDSGDHESRHWVKRLASEVGPQIPPNWRICGENLFAKHSILYNDLPSYFLMFSIWDGLTCLSWAETEEWAKLLGLHTVQTLAYGQYVAEPWPHWQNWETQGNEGYVVRRADSFHYREFRQKVGKYVRASHVHTHGHWMREQITKNGLAE